MNKNALHFVLIISLCSLLQSCFNAAATGAQAAYNHHSIKKSLDDRYITYQAYQKAFHDTHQFDKSNISIDTFNRQVLLTGQIPTKKQRQDLENVVKSIPNVEKIYNLTSISTPSSSLIRISDTWITTKIKSRLISMADIDPSQIKVITENGTVYMMGIIMPEQAEIAVDIASSTDGVQNVVKIFKYVHISNKA